MSYGDNVSLFGLESKIDEPTKDRIFLRGRGSCSKICFLNALKIC